MRPRALKRYPVTTGRLALALYLYLYKVIGYLYKVIGYLYKVIGWVLFGRVANITPYEY